MVRVALLISALVSDADPVSKAIAEECTTSVVKGLSTQLIDEVQCMKPGTFSSIEGAPGLKLGSAVFPWLQTPARDALLAAQKERGVEMEINSALRTLPQQLLLYRWYRAKRCGIGLAAEPGKSNHESGLALDIDDNAGWRPSMTNNNFKWLGASDPVHFDYDGPGTVEITGLSVLAFQRLWNRNHPEDKIEEDSQYGQETEERLVKTPVGGFAKGADCTNPSNTPPPANDLPPTGTGARDNESESGCTIVRSSSPTQPTHPKLTLLGGLALLFFVRSWRRRRWIGREEK